MFLCKVINKNCIIRSITENYLECLKQKKIVRFHSQRRLEEAYRLVKNKCQSKKLPKDVNPKAVFACNELDLKEVKVYGFDYDYTLACYKPSLDYLLYNLGRQTLIEQFKYPQEISKLEYKPGFAVRGLHYDIEKGVLLKLDSFLQIQFGSVYKGLTPLSNEDVLKLYKNRIIPIAYVEGHTKNAALTLQDTHSKMIQLADLFSVPEMCLICNVADYFDRNHIDYHPEILFRDIKNSIKSVHPVMHKVVSENVSEYIESNDKLRTFFDRLIKANKKLFLVTNSPYGFVNKGMEFMVGSDWKDLFDVLIVQARKPKFFTDVSRPIRVFDERSGTHIWDRVTKLEKGVIYYEGTVKQLQDLTGWRGHQVLYYGDHPYSDLADVTLEHGWRTGAIITELTHEIATLNMVEFKKNANWLQMLTQLIEDHQDCEDEEEQKVLAKWMAERDKLSYVRSKLEYGWTIWDPYYTTHSMQIEKVQRKFCKYLAWKEDGVYPQQGYDHTELLQRFNLPTLESRRNDIKFVFNEQFGSVFRTYHNPTYFSRRLFRFADIYTSNIANLLNYSVNHTFYPRRGVMPHEYISYFV